MLGTTWKQQSLTYCSTVQAPVVICLKTSRWVIICPIHLSIWCELHLKLRDKIWWKQAIKSLNRGLMSKYWCFLSKEVLTQSVRCCNSYMIKVIIRIRRENNCQQTINQDINRWDNKLNVHQCHTLPITANLISINNNTY